jgi:hypothetical protein
MVPPPSSRRGFDYCLLPFDELREDPDAEPEADAD